MPLILLAAAVIIVLWVIITYNLFIRWRNLMREAWSGVDVQLKRRYDLIPNLVETVKGYSRHEKELFEKITQLRNEGMNAENVKQRGQIENALTQGIRSLFAVAEAYPDLKANQNFLDLQKNLVLIEDEIQLARRYYNGTVRNNNILVESFPSLLVANLGGFKKADYFELENVAEREAPKTDFTPASK
jgi:LemA protein